MSERRRKLNRWLEIWFSGFTFVRAFIGGKWASDGSGFYSWVSFNDPGDDLAFEALTSIPGFVGEEYHSVSQMDESVKVK